MNTEIISTKSGSLFGIIEDRFLVFKGVPYAKAERFKPPVPCHWDNILDCTQYGKKAMQVFEPRLPWMPVQTRAEFDEDCQNLNIYVPRDKDPMKKLPVLVEIHGGAFQNGSNQGNTGHNVIRDEQIIYVSINYRLGVFGFLYLGELLGEDYQTSGNNGLLDQLAAIHWIYENIEAFGGDPERITVLGASAGAKSIGALMMIREFDQYVSQVILSSGATQSIRSIDTSVKTTSHFIDTLVKTAPSLGYDKELLTKTHIKDTLLHMSSDDLLKVQQIFCDNPGSTCMFGPVADGIIIETDWQEQAIHGTYWSGRALVGCSRNEMMGGKLADPDFLDHAPINADHLFGQNTVLAKESFTTLCTQHTNAYKESPSAETQKDFWVRILTDYMYRTYSYRIANRLAAKKCDTWLYCVEFYPALHCSDQGLAFGEPDTNFYQTDEEKEAFYRLGTRIRTAYHQFIKGEDPDWQPMTITDRICMYFDKESVARSIPEHDVLTAFPEEVYIL